MKMNEITLSFFINQQRGEHSVRGLTAQGGIQKTEVIQQLSTFINRKTQFKDTCPRWSEEQDNSKARLACRRTG